MAQIYYAESGCWNFTGALNGDGYGAIKSNGVQWRAHRLSWTLHHGEIPSKLDVLHKCIGNRRCCNPEHLYLGTVRQNTDDRMAQGRQHDGRGEKCPTHKLTEIEVIKIRSMRWTHKPDIVAAEFHVSEGAIWGVWTHANWKHLPPSPPKPVDNK